MSELFATEQSETKTNIPLADRIRPVKFIDIIGQEHLTAEGAPLNEFFKTKNFPSIIFWGPPGVGKTTFSYLIAETCDYHFVKLSAIDSGVKEVRQVIASAELYSKKMKRTLLFIDEIHRFNKTQQDSLLHAVEKGIVILIGATTENPSFEINSALLSRCQVYRLHLLNDEQIKAVVNRAITEDEILKNYNIIIQDWDFIQNIAGGDARSALNAIELCFNLASKENNEIIINKAFLEKALQQKTAHYDKKGDSHYDIISAFIKSMRGSDPDAALLWLSKMLDAGEDPRFIARRMVIFASEDIGNADPFALTLAISVFQAVELIGMPEAQINLAHGVTYLASCAKSNASYIGLMEAIKVIKNSPATSVPLHLRNAPTKLMKQEGYGEAYKYPHDFDEHFVSENYFPTEIEPCAYYRPGDFGKEAIFKERLKKIWAKK